MRSAFIKNGMSSFFTVNSSARFYDRDVIPFSYRLSLLLMPLPMTALYIMVHVGGAKSRV